MRHHDCQIIQCTRITTIMIHQQHMRSSDAAGVSKGHERTSSRERAAVVHSIARLSTCTTRTSEAYLPNRKISASGSTHDSDPAYSHIISCRRCMQVLIQRWEASTLQKLASHLGMQNWTRVEGFPFSVQVSVNAA